MVPESGKIERLNSGSIFAPLFPGFAFNPNPLSQIVNMAIEALTKNAYFASAV